MYNNKRHNKRDRDNSEFRSLQVKVYYTGDTKEQKDADLEKALSKFKKLIMKSGLVQELRDRAYFKSPGQKRYEKRKKFLYKLNNKKDKTEKRYTRNKDK